MDRHGIKHLVGQHHAGQPVWQLIEPLHPLGQMRHALFQQGLLARAQIPGQFEDAIALGQGIEPFQFSQQIAGQFAAAGTKFKHLR